MANNALQVLAAARLTAIVQGLQDVRSIPQDLVFLRRTPIVPTLEGEIMAHFVGRVQIADIVADDQAANTYNSGKMQFEGTAAPNLKHGRNVTQAELALLDSVNRGGITNDETGMFNNFIDGVMAGNLLGIRQRMEALIIAMKTDSFVYDRLGIKSSGSFGMPADLKVTPVYPWDDHTNATPVTDILTQRLIGSVRYGQNYNRATMSTTAFRHMVQCTQFINLSRATLPLNYDAATLTLFQSLDPKALRPLAANVLGLDEIEFYDARYWSQGGDGVLTSYPYLPVSSVVLSSTADDNDPTSSDFANGIVTESLVSSMVPTTIVGRFNGPTRGPVGYATAPPDLNPPNLTLWGVARGFPRKHRFQETSVLNTGTYSDMIPATDPF